jgi:DNA-binding transcriptional LysR family regulator
LAGDVGELGLGALPAQSGSAVTFGFPMETPLTDLGDLRAFCLVVDLGSITAAAKALGEGKGSVSRRLSRLEATVEAKLLRRTPRLVQATDEGVAFRAQVGRVLEQLDDATATLRQARSLPSGNLRVTAPYDLGVTIFAPLIAEFAEMFPAVTVEMVLTEAVLNFESHQIDVALRPASSLHDSPSLVAHRLSSFYMGLYAAPSYLRTHGAPTKPEDLTRHRLAAIRAVGGTVSLTMWKVGDAAKKKTELRVRASLAASDHAFCREAALGGYVIAPLPSILVGPDLESGRLVRILEPYVLGEASLYFVYLGSRLLQPKIRAFRDFMIERHGVARERARTRE